MNTISSHTMLAHWTRMTFRFDAKYITAEDSNSLTSTIMNAETSFDGSCAYRSTMSSYVPHGREINPITRDQHFVNPLTHGRIFGQVCLVVFLVASCVGPLIMPGVAVLAASHVTAGPSTLSSTTLVSAPPTGAKGPDDITLLSSSGLDGGTALIWVAFQNGVMTNGTAGTPGGPSQSTVAGYDPTTGTLVRTIAVTGKVDGLTADQARGRLIATVNEDDHSAFNLIDPATSTVTTYKYNPDPAISGNGGTDSIAVSGDQIYVSHSNPDDTKQATDYLVALDNSTYTANVTPLFFDNSTATNVVTGATVHLSLTDPDTNFLMPSTSPNFAGDLATISQADGQIVFASLGGSPTLSVLNLTDNVPGNAPPADGLAVATADQGTLYVVDNGAGTIQALNTTGWPAGTVFIGEPNDNKNPLVGTLDLTTGKITPLGNTFKSPKGLLFIPAQSQMMTASTTTSYPATSSSASGSGFSIAGLPGFPVESIILGIVVGLAALIVLRRRRQ